MSTYILKFSELYRSCDTNKFKFKTTDDLEDLKDYLGQTRAIDALKFGVGIERKGFNLFVLGSMGTGRHAMVRRYLDKISKTREVPDDWCYVHNFEQDDQPVALQLPPGMGKKLKKDMKRLVEELKIEIPAAFEEDSYHKQKTAIEENFFKTRREKFKVLEDKSLKKSIALMETQSGFVFAPKKAEKVLTPEEYESLPKADKDRFEKDIDALQIDLKNVAREIPTLRRIMADKIKALDEETTQEAIEGSFAHIQKKYLELPNVIEFLDFVQKDVVQNVDQFFEKEHEHENEKESDGELPYLRRYDVNVFVDHASSKGAPVVYESHPTYHNLIGRVELKPTLSSYVTDFLYIKPGAIHKANGGYLVLDAHKLLMQPQGWESLKIIMRTGEIRIESLGQLFNMASTVSLDPETIPLNVKVILIGDRDIYYTLSELDPEFLELFKVAVDFEDEFENSEENVLQYARLIATMAKKEHILPISPCGVGRLIEYSQRLADDHHKLSANILSVIDVLREADYWARENKSKLVMEKEVNQAILMQVSRLSRIRDRMHENILEGTKLIDTKGEKVGQINGLSVLSIGNFDFGQPTRITATARLGRGQVIDVEREAELGGSLHTKGVMIITQFLGSRYAKNLPLSLNASLVFEQSYGMIDGDSASTAELCALLSALSNLPISQSIAVTGSINQNGEVQAIGGVNEKIEGFFDVCRERGLTGKQGVIIPKANQRNLMLRHDVVEAVEKGKFTVYAVETVDDALEVLMGYTAGTRGKNGAYPENTINGKVSSRLEEMAELHLKMFIPASGMN